MDPDEIDYILNEIEEYLDDHADASAEGDPLEYHPNKAMQLLNDLRRVRRAL